MRLVQRATPCPLCYVIAALGSLATVFVIVFLATWSLEKTLRALTTISPYAYLRVFVVIGVISLASVVSYRSGLWNIGQEGQAIVGALAALTSQNALEALALALLAAAGWVLAPALLRVGAGVNEAVSTFLTIFVAIYVARYFVEGPLRDLTKKGFIVSIEAPAVDLHVAFLVLAFIAMGVILLYRTRAGLYLRLLSSSEGVVRYSGKRPGAYILLALTISGALSGVGGALEIMSREAGRYMMIQQVSTGFGFYGIAASWLGGLNPLGVLASSLYIAWLYEVAINLKVFGLPALVANALVGTAMAWGLTGYMFYRYRVVWR
ncbi:MAG: ABC transporter permease subunit [Pyrobaculum sp.]